MISTLSLVALGGALGAVLRYLFGIGLLRVIGPTEMPLGMIGVNILGSFLMGILFVYVTQRGLTQFGPLVLTGLLGGFTTFSAFSLEATMLIERGQVTLAAFYIGASVVLSILGLTLGLWLARGIWA